MFTEPYLIKLPHKDEKYISLLQFWRTSEHINLFLNEFYY